MKNYPSFFKEKIGFEPYNYQTKVANILLQQGKNVILSVPTGAGKTLTSVIPYLYAKYNSDIHFPQKLIYSLPLRALANSIHQDISGISKSSIQTGEYSEDVYFENDIVFSTIDQTLSNFLCFPLPLSHRQANINCGALIGSYLVFDEFHLLDNGLSMATTLGMLRILNNLSRFCIMTATLTNSFMDSLKESLPNCEIVTIENFEEDKKNIGSLKPVEKKKSLKVIDQTISSEKILETHKTKTIVICNRVETAQLVYNEILSRIGNQKNTEVICLHSRFYDKDRKSKEEKLKLLFGKKSDKNINAILISTQVIEAGMDISCELMHTEISPINSFLQRAGRCARFADQIGTIYVYNVLKVDEKEKILLEPENEEDKKEIRQLNNKYLPYEKGVCEVTFNTLKQFSTLDGKVPELLVNNILSSTETNLINQLKVADFNRNRILNSWLSCEKNHYRNTVRDVQNVEITLIDNQRLDEMVKYPFRYQSLSMYKWSFVGWLYKTETEEGDWLVKRLVEGQDMFLENDEGVNHYLTEIPRGEYKNLPNQIYVNAKYFGYSPDFGFNRYYSETFGKLAPERVFKENNRQMESLKKDSFYQHNKALIGVFESDFLQEDKRGLDFILSEIGSYIGSEELQKEDFIQLITLMLILHDYGKLNENWQKPMQFYQALKDGKDFANFKEVLGHTDFNFSCDSDAELAKRSKIFSRPAHAGVGAYISQEILPDLYDNDYLTSSISTAISRHHSPLSNTFPSFKIPEDYYSEVKRLLSEFGFDIEIECEGDADTLEGFVFDGISRVKEQVLYLFFVRILRLCDQKATMDFDKYFKERNYV